MDGGGAFAQAGARIGPNAILQLVPVLDAALGRDARCRLLSGVDLPPADAGMWPEAACRAAHLAVWRGCGDGAAAIFRAAGQGTAHYILDHRIPRPAQALIRALPAPLGARLLTSAIARHAWTFAGSGRFRVAARRPLTIEIAANPLGFAGRPCLWHAAVLTGLFSALVWPAARAEAIQTGPDSRVVIFPR